MTSLHPPPSIPLSPWQRADSVGEGDGETRTPVCQKHASGTGRYYTHNEKHLKVHNPRHFIQSLCRHSFAHACSILVTTIYSKVRSHNPPHFILCQQPTATSYTTSVTPSLNGLTGAYRQTTKSSPDAQSIIYSDRPGSLFDAHSPRQPSVSPASPAFSAPESYFTMHASYLIICLRFTLGVAAVTEKNGGQTDGRTHAHTHTHTHTDRPTAITLRCACAQARVLWASEL